MRAGVDASAAAANRIAVEWFLRIDLASETIRYTSHPLGYYGDIDGTGTRSWDFYDFKVGNLSDSTQSVNQVSYVDIVNLDGAWSSRIFGTDTARDKPIYLWSAQLDKDDGATLIAVTQRFGGRIEGAEFDGSRIKISMLPRSPLWASGASGSLIEPRCPYIYKDTDTCQVASPVTATCDKTRANCFANGNLSHFGGEDLMPPPDSQITWGAQTYGLGSGVGTQVIPNPWYRPPKDQTINLILSQRNRPSPRVVDFRGAGRTTQGGGPTPPPVHNVRPRT